VDLADQFEPDDGMLWIYDVDSIEILAVTDVGLEPLVRRVASQFSTSRNALVRRPPMQRAVHLLFVATIVLAPVPLGSNRDWSWSPLAAVVGLLLVAATAVAVDRQSRFALLFQRLAVPGVLFVLVLGWAMVQVTGWTPLAWDSPVSASADLAVPEIRHSVALDREQQFTAVMRLLTYAGVFVLAAFQGSSSRSARSILGSIVLGAVLYTLYAMTADIINRESRFTGISVWIPHEGYFTGTFVNSNNYATYTGVAALTALALGMGKAFGGGRGESANQRRQRRLAELSGRSGLWFAASLVLAIGVLLSDSRAGCASLGLAFATVVAFSARGRWRVPLTLATPILLAATALLLPRGGDRVDRTAILMAVGDASREGLFALTANAISLRPMIGWGMNSFEKLYGVFQPPSLLEYYDKAHNTYLELAFDLGIPAAIALLLAILWIVGRCLKGFLTRGRNRELAGLGFFASVLAGFHALFDFSLQIPAMACTYFAILGVAWAQSWSTRAEKDN
jgi:O-antigen ligase